MPTQFVVEANASLGKDRKNLVVASRHVLSVLPVEEVECLSKDFLHHLAKSQPSPPTSPPTHQRAKPGHRLPYHPEEPLAISQSMRSYIIQAPTCRPPPPQPTFSVLRIMSATTDSSDGPIGRCWFTQKKSAQITTSSSGCRVSAKCCRKVSTRSRKPIFQQWMR